MKNYKEILNATFTEIELAKQVLKNLKAAKEKNFKTVFASCFQDEYNSDIEKCEAKIIEQENKYNKILSTIYRENILLKLSNKEIQLDDDLIYFVEKTSGEHIYIGSYRFLPCEQNKEVLIYIILGFEEFVFNSFQFNELDIERSIKKRIFSQIEEKQDELDELNLPYKIYIDERAN